MLIITRDFDNNIKDGVESTALLACVSSLGKSKKTLALQMSPKSSYTILNVTNGRFTKQSIHDIYSFEDNGLDSLLMNAESNTVTEETMNDTVSPILDNNKLDVMKQSDYPKILDVFSESSIQNILNYLTNSKNRLYDHVYIYLPLDDTELYKIVEPYADTEILFVPQKPVNIDKYMTPKTFVVLKDYEPESKFDLQYLKKQLKTKRIYTIPWNVGYRDAIISEDLLSFVHKNRKDMKGDDNFTFISSVTNLVSTFVLGKEQIEGKIKEENFRKHHLDTIVQAEGQEPEKTDDLPENAIQQVKVTKRKFFRKVETDEIMINLKHNDIQMDTEE